MIEAPSKIAARFGHLNSNREPAGAFSAEVEAGSAQKTRPLTEHIGGNHD
jgi:hypothetical protein